MYTKIPHTELFDEHQTVSPRTEFDVFSHRNIISKQYLQENLQTTVVEDDVVSLDFRAPEIGISDYKELIFEVVEKFYGDYDLLLGRSALK